MQHLGIIMDGNRRWAKRNGKLSLMGHKAGYDNAIKISELVGHKGIKYLTLWALSKENLENRSSDELNGIIGLIELIPTLIPTFHKNKTVLETIGDISKLPQRAQRILREVKESTQEGSEKTLILALVYSGQDEIIRGFKKYLNNGNDISNLETSSFRSFLDTGCYPVPDLIIRTGGSENIRHSGFLLYDSAYSEYYFSDKLWPDFDEEELDKALNFFETTKRNFGK